MNAAAARSSSEVNEQIVGNERERFRSLQMILNRSKPQRQVELIGRTRAHGGYKYNAAAGPHSPQMCGVLIIKYDLKT